MNSRERVLKLFAGEAVDRSACFSGMGNVTTEGLKILGPEVRGDPPRREDDGRGGGHRRYKLFGFECGVVPFDLCVEAEAMGCEINVYAHSEDLLYPTIKKKLIHNEAEMEITDPVGPHQARPGAADGRGDRPAEKGHRQARRRSVPTCSGPSRLPARSWS